MRGFPPYNEHEVQQSVGLETLCTPPVLEHVRRFNGDAALLFIFARVCEAGLSGPGRSDNPSLGHQGVRQGGLPMIHMGDHRHVSDVGLLVHDGSDLIHRKVHLLGARAPCGFHTLQPAAGV